MLLNCGHYSENKNGDEQNKNRWGLQNCGHHSEDRCGDKQKNMPMCKNRWGLVRHKPY